MTPDATFYILMRTDLDSMNPGKAMAQASHAYPAMAAYVKRYWGESSFFSDLLERWQSQSEQSFGRTIVLGGTPGEISDVLQRARHFPDVLAEWVVDPTYPLRDGVATHLIPLQTCAYVFGPTDRGEQVTKFMRLHP